MSVLVAIAVAQAVGSVIQGVSRFNQLSLEAEEAEFQARLENLKAQEEANTIRQQLIKDLASANATFASRNVNPQLGSAGVIQRESTKSARLDIKTALFGGSQRNLSKTMQSSSIKRGGKLSLISSVVGGGAQAFQTAQPAIRSQTGNVGNAIPSG